MIEFIKNEPYCRWNGTLMTPEKCEELFGVEGELDICDEVIFDGETYYTDLSFGEFIEFLAKTYGKIYGDAPEWDNVLNLYTGSGALTDQSWREKVANHYLIPIGIVKGMKVLEYNAFKKDYPNFNEKGYYAFYDELYDYCEKLRKGE